MSRYCSSSKKVPGVSIILLKRNKFSTFAPGNLIIRPQSETRLKENKALNQKLKSFPKFSK
jgi:hypothetical protein